MIAVPGSSGKHIDGLVELVDVFPTVIVMFKFDDGYLNPALKDKRLKQRW